MINSDSINNGMTFERLNLDSKIGYQSIAIYDVLSSMSYSRYKCTATVQELCDRLQMSEKTFYKYQRPLLDNGYISSKHQGGTRGNVYTLELVKSVDREIRNMERYLSSDDTLCMDISKYFYLALKRNPTPYELEYLASSGHRNNVINYAIYHAMCRLEEYEWQTFQPVLYASRVMSNWDEITPLLNDKDDMDVASQLFKEKNYN